MDSTYTLLPPQTESDQSSQSTVIDERDTSDGQLLTIRQQPSRRSPRYRQRTLTQMQAVNILSSPSTMHRGTHSTLRLRTQHFPFSKRPFWFSTSFKSYSDMVEITVGASETLFVVHRELLTLHSQFFRAAFEGGFREAEDGKVHLPDVEAKYFEHVVLWVYSESLEERAFFFKDGKPTYFTLLDLYALADRLDIEGMRNALCDRIAVLAEDTNSVPTPSDTYILYETIRPNAPIKQLVLDLFAFKKTDNLIATHPDDWHPTFLRDLVCKLKRPGLSTLKRHELRLFKPQGWQFTKACKLCKAVLKPGGSENHRQCVRCKSAFCENCVEKGEGGGPLDWSAVERECKPYLAAMCGCYHEHDTTGVCGTTLGGRAFASPGTERVRVRWENRGQEARLEV